MSSQESFKLHPTVLALLTADQIENLKTLAYYLLSLPSSYAKFNMRNYAVLDKSNSLSNIDPEQYRMFLEAVDEPNSCGTVACAIGHGPAAGIPIHFEDWNWGIYSIKFINFQADEVSDAMWDWCFASIWEQYDNTHHGAAKRILYLLRNGLPDEWVSPWYNLTSPFGSEKFHETVALYQ